MTGVPERDVLVFPNQVQDAAAMNFRWPDIGRYTR